MSNKYAGTQTEKNLEAAFAGEIYLASVTAAKSAQKKGKNHA